MLDLYKEMAENLKAYDPPDLPGWPSPQIDNLVYDF